MTSRVTWVAIYNDGSHLKQIDENGNEHSSEEIDRSKLKCIDLFCDGIRFYRQYYANGQKVIFRRRVSITSRGGSDSIEVVYIIGWKKEVGGEEITSVAFISENPDGSLFVTSRPGFDPNHGLYYPVVPANSSEEMSVGCEKG